MLFYAVAPRSKVAQVLDDTVEGFTSESLHFLARLGGMDELPWCSFSTYVSEDQFAELMASTLATPDDCRKDPNSFQNQDTLWVQTCTPDAEFLGFPNDLSIFIHNRLGERHV